MDQTQLMDFMKDPKISNIVSTPEDGYPTKLLNPIFKRQNLYFEFKGGIEDER